MFIIFNNDINIKREKKFNLFYDCYTLYLTAAVSKILHCHDITLTMCHGFGFFKKLTGNKLNMFDTSF